MILAANLSLFTLLFLLGHRTGIGSGARAVFALLFAAGLLNAAHYTGIFRDAAWYYEYRSHLPADFTPALTGLLCGTLLRYGRLASATTLFIALCAIVAPEFKTTVMPVNYAAMTDHRHDGGTRQTTGSSCGPAGLATLMNRQGSFITEREIAEDCGTSNTGTEVWRLARFARARGFACRFSVSKEPPSAPALIGTRLGAIGHFVALLENQPGRLVIWDPGRGLREHTSAASLNFTGFAMSVAPAGN